MSEHQHGAFFRKFCTRSWWTIVFSTLTIAFYFQAAHSRSTIFSDLSLKMQEMEKEKHLALEEQEELSLQLQSETDPAWIEMVLMKELGVVPEGWTKVQFTK